MLNMKAEVMDLVGEVRLDILRDRQHISWACRVV
jgi:hypothetical protein